MIINFLLSPFFSTVAKIINLVTIVMKRDAIRHMRKNFNKCIKITKLVLNFVAYYVTYNNYMYQEMSVSHYEFESDISEIHDYELIWSQH